MSSAITTCSSPISLNVVGPVSFTTATTPAPSAKSSVEPSIFPVPGLSLEDKNLIYQEVEEPHIGGMILEIAGYQQETSHDSPPVSLLIFDELFLTCINRNLNQGSSTCTLLTLKSISGFHGERRIVNHY